MFFAPKRFDWGEQIVVITGGTEEMLQHKHPLIVESGSSGIGELLANTLAVRNVNVVVLDVKPIVTENCEFVPDSRRHTALTVLQIT